MNYDIIGDIHGQADKLVNLLEKMGYTLHDNVWTHSSRQVIFVGDFIDRGLQQLATVDIARSMVESGTALAILGNHELNAIAWFMPHPERVGEYLRPHPPYKEVIKIVTSTKRFCKKLNICPKSIKPSLIGF
jgi:hypothetical protein